MLHYYLGKFKIRKIFYFTLIVFFIVNIIIYYCFYKSATKNDIVIYIPKQSSLLDISKIIKNNDLSSHYIIPLALSIILGYEKDLSYGEYLISKDDSLYRILNKLRNNKIYYRKLTIIEGYEEYQLDKLIKESFLNQEKYNFDDYLLIADTFLYFKNQNIKDFLNKIEKFTKNLYENNKNTNESIDLKTAIIISSLVEKEAYGKEDKKLISSVIYNRLNKNMKLDIDATTIYAITKGKYKFNRKLTYKDLKLRDEFNTYIYKGLPPKPICIPGTDTLKIVLQKHKSPYYYYYFDENKNSHIFSKTYKEHLSKLNEYRKTKKS